MTEADLPISSQPEESQSSLESSSKKVTPSSENSSEKSIKSQTFQEGTGANKELNLIMELALKDLHQRKNDLNQEIEELLARKSQLEDKLKESFTGQSDAIARRVKGFQDYLTGALQDLAHSAEKLDLVVQPVVLQPSPLDKEQRQQQLSNNQDVIPPVAETFQPDEELIRECLQQFLGQPDFYAEPWKLRRSLDHKDIQLLEDWFFSMGGRGAQPSRGNRSKNILVSAALISILGELYGERFQTLVLASEPERLGEWRRGLQDALGLNREDFGPNSGIVLFERSEGVIERADRLEERQEVPLILIDAAETSVETPILQFPLWLAFAGSPEEIYAEEELL